MNKLLILFTALVSVGCVEAITSDKVSYKMIDGVKCQVATYQDSKVITVLDGDKKGEQVVILDGKVQSVSKKRKAHQNASFTNTLGAPSQRPQTGKK